MQTKRISLLLAAVLTSSALSIASTAPGQDEARLRRVVLQRADHLAHQTLSSLSRGRDECSIVASLAANATVHDLRSDLALALAACINEESGTPAKFAACLKEIFEEFNEGLDLLVEQHAARLDLCDLTGGGIYDPDLDEDEFVEGVEHEYLPWSEEANWVYRVTTSEGVEEVTVTILSTTFDVDDIECIEVRDIVTLDGELVEDTIDWFAQDEDDTVWYMGEIARDYEDGVLVSIDGSWRAGEDGGLPGVIMMGEPTVGTTYRQELLLNEAEDAGTILSLSETVTIGSTVYTDCIMTADFTPLEPDTLEYKYYAPGVGLVLEVDAETGDRLELISFTPGS